MPGQRITRVPNFHDELRLMKRMNRVIVPVNAGWSTSVTGSGAVVQTPFYGYVRSGVTTGSTSIMNVPLMGLARSANDQYYIDFTKKISIRFTTVVVGNNAANVRYWQLKQVATHGDLAAAGIGLKLSNLTLYGESYGSGRGEVNLMTLVASKEYHVVIEHDPVAGTIKWYVGGVLKGTQSTAANVPVALTAAAAFMVLSVTNGASISDAFLYTSVVEIIQEV